MRKSALILPLLLLATGLLWWTNPGAETPRPVLRGETRLQPPVSEKETPVARAAQALPTPQALSSATPVEDFAAWVQKYHLAATAQRTPLLAEGEKLAMERKRVLLDWIVQKPEAALRAAIPEHQRKFLPPSIQPFLERRINARGDLALVAATPAPGRRAAVKRAIYREARLGDEAYEAHVYGRRLKQETKYGTSLQGIVLDNRMAVLDEPAQVLTADDVPEGVKLEPGLAAGSHPVPQGQQRSQPVLAQAGAYYPVCCAEHAAYLVSQAQVAEEQPGAFVEGFGAASSGGSGPSIAAASPTQGAKSVLVIVADFSDFPGRPVDKGPSPDESMTTGYITNRLGTEASDFFEQCSYGKSSIGTVTVTNVLRLSGTLAGYATAGNANGLKNAALAAAATAGFTTSNYDRVAVVFADTSGIGGNQFGFAGLADIAGSFSWFNGYFTLAIVTHELGHNYGLRHANLWQIPGGSLNPVDPAGSSDEYGDVFDVMGEGPGNAATQPSHFNPWFLNRIDWLPNTAVQTISSGGSYRLYRFDHAGADLATTRALKVRRDASTTYWLGLRRKYLGNASLGDVANGAYITWGYDSNVQSNLIDIDTPGTDARDASLNVGSTFTDSAAGISFEVTASGGSGAGEYIDVNVQFESRLVFSQPAYDVDELAGTLSVTVQRENSSDGAVSVNYTTSNGTALAGSDYTTTANTLTWANGDATPRTIVIPILNDPAVEGAETFSVVFSALTGAVMPNGLTLPITIQEAGALDKGFIGPFLTSAVNDAKVQPDGKVVIGGFFDIGGGSPVLSAGITRLKATGGHDAEFDVGTGVNYDVNDDVLPVQTVAIQQDGKVLVGGSFTKMRDVTRNRIARFNVDGSLDTSFNAGTGPNDEVKVIKVQPDGKILVGGGFTSWNGAARPCLVRLNEDGTLDTSLASFDAVADFFAGAEVSDIALQPMVSAPHFRILVAGYFYRQFASGGYHSGIMALNANNGSRDASFNVIYGAHQQGNSGLLTSASSLALQPDGKVVVGGSFDGFNNVDTNMLVRLTNVGANDTTFIANLGDGLQPSAPGNYADVLDLLVQNDGKIVVGGTFDSASGTSLTDMVRYSAEGNLDSLFVPPMGPSLGVKSFSLQPDGKVVVGLNGAGNSSGVSNAVRRFFTSMPAPPSVVQFAATSVSGDEGTNAVLTVSRTGGSLGAISVNYSTIARTATAGSDYTTTTGTLTWADGNSAAKTISVPLLADALLFESAEVLEVRLGAPVGGMVMGANKLATVSISAPTNVTNLSFATASSSFAEGAGAVQVTVNAYPVPAGPVSVVFTTSGSATKAAGKDYTISASPVSFAAGEASKTITVTILQDLLLDTAETVNLQLSTITGAAILGSQPTHALTIVDDEAAPVVTLSPTSRFANVGSATTFTSAATASPAPTFQWRKGTAALAGATASSYTIPKVAMTHAGSYSVLAKSVGLSAPSSAADLVVVDATAKRIVVPTTSAPVKMTASYAGNVTGFQWQKDSMGLTGAPGDIDGVTTKMLTLTGLTTADTGVYRCVLNSPTAGSGSSALFSLKVTTAKPEFVSKPASLTGATVGAFYTYQTNLDTADQRAPVTLTATGLPPGMSIDIDGLITGTAYVALTLPKVYSVVIKATNSHGSDSFTTTLTLSPLPAGTVGNFAGAMPRNAGVNDSLGGRFDVTTSTSGSFTGTIVNAAAVHKISGKLLVHPMTLVPSAVVTIPRTNDTSLTLSFEIDAPNNRIQTASMQDGADTITFTAWRDVLPSTDYQGYFTFGMDMPGGNPTAPQGTGYGSFTIGTNGKLTAAGKLADGIAFSTATFVGLLGEVLVHQASATADTVVGALDIAPGTPATLTGSVTWSRKAQAASSRLYEDSFGPVTLTPVGGIYEKPLATAPVMGLAYTAGVTTTNASLTFTSGDFGTPPVAPDVPVLIKAAGLTVVPPVAPLNGSTNVRKTTLKVLPATGMVSGGFTMVDANPLAPAANITRAGTWFGGIFLEGGVQKSRGFFLLNNLPAVPGETKDNTDTVSGKVVLQ
jgi:uncharacterized delta-60 repeat protein